ncbi:MAG: DnaJ domain-containing protein [Gammaproteobacteria bacterium]|nr:DnaJ domain-containing protein [Gammaproteobacteria bacterium]
MSRAEAYEVLGLSPGASQEEIQTAYRRLMQRLHPDHGGSAYLAARLNQARQVLLQEDL